ncbi:glutaredoxin family protein [Mycolicibacterium elephantis]|nr:glutaredoxin family protein [Mycolicibacterium elephantis]
MTMLSTVAPRGRMAAPALRPVVVYGRRWCALTQMVRRYLDRSAIPYRYVDLDQHPEVHSQLAWMTGGRVVNPVVDIGGELVVQPSIGELQWALRRSGRR